jgi:endonuclease-3
MIVVMKHKNASSENRITQIIHILQAATNNMVRPSVTTIVAKYGQDPFLVLISCLLSLRTKDAVSLPASERLFDIAKTPRDMILVSPQIIEKAIYPTGFYRQKTKQILRICALLLEKYNGLVPNTPDGLIALPGVGPKTVSLVLSEGFGIPAICVDTHVHRISNRLGIIQTKTPAETEIALKEIIPKKYWSAYNALIVMWGQNVCVPISPFCSRCPLLPLCEQNGVEKSR